MSPLLSIRFLQRQPDADLVALVSSGSDRAFEMLVKRYRRPLLAYARRISGSDGRAEDALQQALLQAWVALKGGAQPAEVRPWLFRIVHNVVVNGLRRPQHRYVELDEALDAADRGDTAEARLECRDALTELAALPELQRRAIVLTAFGGDSHDEVAAQLGLSGGAVRGLIYRARATLREAAAALLPTPIVAWLETRSARRPPGLERTAELLAGGGSVGAGGVLLKAGAIAATAGALATASQLIVPGSPAARGSAHARVVRRATAAGSTAAGPGTAVRAVTVAASLRAESAVAGTSARVRIDSFQRRRLNGGGSARLSATGAEGTSGGSDGGRSGSTAGTGEHGSDGGPSGTSGGGVSSGGGGSDGGSTGSDGGSSGSDGGGFSVISGTSGSSGGSSGDGGGGGSDGGSTLTTSGTSNGGGSDGGGTSTTSTSGTTSGGGTTTLTAPSTSDGGGTSGDMVTTSTSDGGGGTSDGSTIDGGGGSRGS